MPSALVQTMQRSLMGVAAASMLAMFAPPSGNTQGISATARVTASGSLDPASLQKQLQALEKRVADLEREALETADDVDASEAAATLVERRLRDNETAVKELATKVGGVGRTERQDKPDAEKEAKGTSDAADDRPTTVTAPFTVVDGDGKPILRVGEDDGSFSRGLYVFNDKGASIAHMGARTDGLGRIYASRPNTTPTAVLTAQPEGGALLLGNGTAFIVELNRQSLSFMTDSKATVALFGTKNRAKGYMELNDSSGNKMVEAGMLNSNKGYVLANPYSASVTPQGDPSVLKGAGK